jgi:hypothetical protein
MRQSPLSRDGVAFMQQFSPNVRYAFQRMWRLGYGTFRGVHVRDGDIVLDPPFRVVRTAKFPESTTSRRTNGVAEFPLKPEHIAFRNELVSIHEGVIDVAKVHDGVPVVLEIDEQP